MVGSLDHLSIINGEIKPGLPNFDDTQPSDHNAHVTLDGLSLELKVAILQFMPNIRTLVAIIRSSPLFHGAYANQRQNILSKVLLRDLEPRLFPEALSLYEASNIPCGDAANRKESVEGLLARYRAQRDTTPPFPPSSPDLETLEALARFWGVVTDTTSDFCRSKLSHHPLTHESLQGYDEPSDHEKGRIYRALYRFELFYILFNMPLSVDYDPDGSDPDPFDWMDKSHLFLSIFNPWEVEEIACIRDYIMERYESMFSQCLDSILEFRPSREAALRSRFPTHCKIM